MRFMLVVLLFTSGLTTHAQNALFPLADIQSRSRGGTGVAETGIGSVFTNPAGLAFGTQGISAQATAEQRFGISDLSIVSASAAYGREVDGFGLQLAGFGFATYQETRIGLAYGRKLTENFSIGAEVTGFGTQTENYAGSFDVTFGIGAQLIVAPTLTVGARVFSPLRVERAEDDPLPQVLVAGLAYRPTDQLVLLIEAVQDSELPFQVRAGLEYLPVEVISIRLGAITGEGEFTFGAGYRVGEKIEIGVAGAYHQRLGFSPVFGLIYR